jgi:pimeloyl-ACP methyl ester carboxylesterase
VVAAAEHAIGPRALGRVRFVDVGQPGWRPFVFFGGLGTDLGAFRLTEVARATRERLRLRAVSVERNGFGTTPFDPALTYGDAVDDVLAVLAALDIGRFAVVAFSGGAPFAAALAARVPERVLSLHLAAAVAGPLAARYGTAAAEYARPEQLAADPALAHEWRLLSETPLPDLSGLDAPAFLYWGFTDEVVPAAHLQEWRRVLPTVAAVRGYPHEAHDVQYVHWRQILFDVAGLGWLRPTAWARTQ